MYSIFCSCRLLVKHKHRTGRVLQLLRATSHWCQKRWRNKLEHIPRAKMAQPWTILNHDDTIWDAIYRINTMVMVAGKKKPYPDLSRLQKWDITQSYRSKQTRTRLKMLKGCSQPTLISAFANQKSSMQQHLQQYSSNALLCLVGEICLSYFNSRPPVLV